MRRRRVLSSMESLVESPQAQLTRDVKMTFSKERTEAMRSWGGDCCLVFGYGAGLVWAYDQEGKG